MRFRSISFSALLLIASTDGNYLHGETNDKLELLQEINDKVTSLNDKIENLNAFEAVDTFYEALEENEVKSGEEKFAELHDRIQALRDRLQSKMIEDESREDVDPMNSLGSKQFSNSGNHDLNEKLNLIEDRIDFLTDKVNAGLEEDNYHDSDEVEDLDKKPRDDLAERVDILHDRIKVLMNSIENKPQNINKEENSETVETATSKTDENLFDDKNCTNYNIELSSCFKRNPHEYETCQTNHPILNKNILNNLNSDSSFKEGMREKKICSDMKEFSKYCGYNACEAEKETVLQCHCGNSSPSSGSRNNLLTIIPTILTIFPLIAYLA